MPMFSVKMESDDGKQFRDMVGDFENEAAAKEAGIEQCLAIAQEHDEEVFKVTAVKKVK